MVKLTSEDKIEVPDVPVGMNKQVKIEIFLEYVYETEDINYWNEIFGDLGFPPVTDAESLLERITQVAVKDFSGSILNFFAEIDMIWSEPPTSWSLEITDIDKDPFNPMFIDKSVPKVQE